MSSESKHKVALVTGAARRIGAEIARELHAANMNIVLHYHTSLKEAENLCGELNSKRNDSAMMVKEELSDISNLNKLVETSLKPWGRLDVLVNNASRFYKTKMGNIIEKEWDDLLNTNLKSPFFLAQAAAPYLKKSRGCIVNIADIHGQRPLKEYSIYSISKAGLIMLTKVLAKEFSPEIRVNAVSPGAIAWPEGNNSLLPMVKEKIIQETALKRHGHPNDVARAVLYLVKDATYVTGQVLVVDGGRV